MALFENGRENNLRACAEMVEVVLAGLGYDVAAARMRADTGPAWGVTSGSARVYIFLTSGDDVEDFIQVVSPVVRPAAPDARLLQHLLELNAGELTGAAFGIRGPDVVITTDRSTTGLDRIEVEDMIRRVADYSDYYDDLLAVEYNAARCSDL